MIEYAIIVGVAAFGAGFVIAYWAKGKMSSRRIKAAEEEAARIINNGKRTAETFLKEAQIEAKDTLFRMKSEFDNETKETRSELKKNELRLMQKEEKIDRKAEQHDPCPARHLPAALLLSPIVIAAFRGGVRCGLLAAVLVDRHVHPPRLRADRIRSRSHRRKGP